jgi:hypothetical protein
MDRKNLVVWPELGWFVSCSEFLTNYRTENLHHSHMLCFSIGVPVQKAVGTVVSQLACVCRASNEIVISTRLCHMIMGRCDESDFPDI